MKPGPAMRHPWILASRKRAAPVIEKRTSSSTATSRSYLPGAGAGSNGNAGGNGSKPGSSAKGLVISPPTPLVAKVSQPASTSKIGHSMSSSKLAQPMSRTGSFKTCESASTSVYLICLAYLPQSPSSRLSRHTRRPNDDPHVAERRGRWTYLVSHDTQNYLTPGQSSQPLKGLSVPITNLSITHTTHCIWHMSLRVPIDPCDRYEECISLSTLL